ncbi:DUF1622 domain-containing protein [Caulobacter sp. 17J80-11]|uniref:DUF1622 domain-containing protein n=1 Tax=Caulobacter sp. 17J80-11 TaxID=2763502 RepID=UPI001653EBEE|nr:DUF1622 domain-containing protein [Caulobacter sp. 17J80-11]MBC6983675.1 DUF1622 domain-containing protein [Caulobacter sp. 17J80-11]
MRTWLEVLVEVVARGAEFATVALVAIGALEAAGRLVWQAVHRTGTTQSKREIWLRFASWILLALEFALGADIVRTAVAPTWDDIGQLAAIATIRTALSWFLERDLSSFEEGKKA